MMMKRFIPVLLLDEAGRLVKTIRFGERTYIGDPFNVVRLFNEFEVDEICVLDIDASRTDRPPNFKFLEQLAQECFMPLAYGGGISTLEHGMELNRCGIEKLVLKTHALNRPLVKSLKDVLGSQALVGCIDYRGYGRKAVADDGAGLASKAKALVDLGFGEIILQSIDKDGIRSGYDLEAIRLVSTAATVPVIALGGAGDYAHLPMALQAGADAAASGSTFTFIGSLRGVLVNYPSSRETAELVSRAHAEKS